MKSAPKKPSVLSYLTFAQVLPLLKLCRERTLQSADILRLLYMPVDLEPKQLATRLNHFFSLYGPHGVFKAILMFLAPYYVVTVLSEMVANWVVTIRAGLLSSFSAAYEQSYQGDRLQLVLMAVKIAAVSVLPPLLEGFSYFRLSELAGQLRAALSGVIADRLFSNSLGHIKRFTDELIKTGKLVNIISIDVQVLQDGVVYLSTVLVMPIKFYQAFSLMTAEMLTDCLSGLMVSVGYLIVQSVLLIVIKKQLERVKLSSDARIRLTQDLIRQQRSIKQLGFLKKCTEQVESLRRQEVTAIRIYLLLLTVSDCMHMLVAPLTQAVIIYNMSSNNTLTLSRMVMMKELVGLLVVRVIVYMPELVKSIPAVMVSLQRVSEFLGLSSGGIVSDRVQSSDDVVVVCEQTRFAIDDNTCTKPLSMTLKKGQRCMISGPSGSGKTMLMEGLSQCIPVASGTMAIAAQPAYLPQCLCMFTGSIRDNIVMGRLFDKQLFELVLQQCDLTDVDPERLVGADGKCLSGGQKQRVALARLVYGRPELCLLDDPFAGLDQKCAETIMKRLFESDHGILAGSTVIIASSCVDMMRMGYDVLVTVDKSTRSVSTNVARVEPIESTSIGDSTIECTISTPSTKSEVEKDTFNLQRVLKTYLSMSGGLVAATAIIAVFLLEQHLKSRQSNTVMSLFDGTTLSADLCQPYLLMTLMMAATKIVYTVLFTCCHGRAARLLHDLFVSKLGRSARMASALGQRALGLASRDMAIVDLELCSAVQALIGTVSIAAGSLSVIIFMDVEKSVAVTLTGLLALVYLSGGVLFYLYNRAWRESKRCMSASNARIVDMVCESAEGLPILRHLPTASRQARLDQLYEEIASQGAAQQFHQTVRRWATLHYELLPILTRLLCDMVAIAMRIKPAVRVIVGDALFDNAEVFEMLAKRLSMVDSALLSVDLMLEVCEEADRGMVYSDQELPFRVQCDDAIELRNVSVSIDKPILRNISVTIKQGERVAIIGRTGAGKSSLFNTLFNTLPSTATISGTVKVMQQDCTNFTGTIPNLVIITQDPCLVAGSVRFNMDPHGRFGDKEITDALQSVNLNIHDLALVLDKEVILSAAEKQCFALARAVLNCTAGSVLLIDEMAARTDQCVLETMTRVIMGLPRSVTILAIMHRINGSFERVIELSAGEIKSDVMVK